MSILGSRKGLMSLEMLLGTILSVVALLIMLNAVFSLLEPSDNLGVVENNVDSIVDFVKYNFDTNNKYSNNQNCFNILKLSNLENFQHNDNVNYFYVIDEKGVYAFDKRFLEKFLQDKSISDIRPVYSKSFGINLNMREDKTDPGWEYTFEVDLTGTGFFGMDFGGHGDFDVNSNLNPPYIYLYQLNREDVGVQRENVFSNMNILISKTLKDDFDNKVGGSYLVYSKDYYGTSNLFFTTSNEISDMYVRTQLCSGKYLASKDLSSYYSQLNYNKIDYKSNNVIHTCSNEIELKWINNYECSGNLCSEFLSTSNLDLSKFESLYDSSGKNKLELYCENKNIKHNLDIQRKTLSEIEADKISFDQVFEKMNFDYNGKKLGKKTLTDEDKKNLFFFKGDNPNKCDSNKYSECFDIILKDGDAYFYVREDSEFDFYKINEKVISRQLFLSKDPEYYFLKKRIPDSDIDDASWWFSIDGYDSYKSAKDQCIDGNGIAMASFNFICKATGGMFATADNEILFKIKLDGNLIEGLEGKDVYVYMTNSQFKNGISDFRIDYPKFTEIYKLFSGKIEKDKIEKVYYGQANANSCNNCAELFEENGIAYFMIRKDANTKDSQFQNKYYSFDDTKLNSVVSEAGTSFFYKGIEVDYKLVIPRDDYYVFNINNVFVGDGEGLRSFLAVLTKEQFLRATGHYIKLGEVSDIRETFSKKLINGQTSERSSSTKCYQLFMKDKLINSKICDNEEKEVSFVVEDEGILEIQGITINKEHLEFIKTVGN